MSLLFFLNFIYLVGGALAFFHDYGSFVVLKQLVEGGTRDPVRLPVLVNNQTRRHTRCESLCACAILWPGIKLRLCSALKGVTSLCLRSPLEH